MGFISDEELNAIRSKANIVDVIGKYIPLTQKGKNYFCVCPFHDDHSPSMSVSYDKQIYKCFSCGASGNVFTFVQNYENVSFNEAVSIVARSVGLNLDFGPVKKNSNNFKLELEIMSLAERFLQNNLKSSSGIDAKKYLEERGINEEIIAEFGIGLSLDNATSLKDLLLKKGYGIDKLIELGVVNEHGFDVFARRITFPLWNIDGDIVGFSGRIYRNEDSAKYVNSKETKIFKKGELLYNYHNAKDYAKREKFILVVEGFMDAIRLSANGIKNVIALMGTSLTSNHIDLLKKLRVKVILCLDNDDAGLTATINNGMMLIKNNVDVGIIRLSGSKDPDEYILKNGIDSFKNLLKEPISYFEFRINSLKNNRNLNNPVELAGYINEVIDILKDVDDPILKEITINEIANNYKIDISLLKERISWEKEKISDVKPRVEKVKHDHQDEVAMRILYYMMNDQRYVNLYKKKLGYITDEKLRIIANEILYYSGIHNKIDVADFITYMSDKDNFKVVTEIVGMNMQEELSEENMLEYISSYYRLMVKKQINDLKIQMKNEMDVNKKLEIGKRITELKKGSVEYGRN